MAQSRTLFVGMDVHQETMAVASVAQEPGAAVPYLGTMGTRHCALAQLLRKMPAQAQHLLFLSEAGPCGSWRSRYLPKKDDDCGGVAPSLRPRRRGSGSTRTAVLPSSGP